jgi:hypothetical protein
MDLAEAGMAGGGASSPAQSPLSAPMPASMSMPMIESGPIPPQVQFPYGFPQAGNYRIFVQIKRAGRIETGVFDARVE